jgi:hypothetical protein
VIQKRELISLLPFTAKQKTKIKRYDPKMKKEIGQVQEKKRKEIFTTIYYHLNHCLCHNISIYIVRSATFFAKKTNDI